MTNSKFAVACALLWAGASAAQDKPAPVVTQVYQQALPTGEEDAPARAETFAEKATQVERLSAEQRLREMVNDSTEGLDTVRLPDGTVGMDLAGRFMHVMVATPTEDGSFVASCHVGEDALTHVQQARDMAAGKLPKLKKAPEPIIVVDRQPVLEEK